MKERCDRKWPQRSFWCSLGKMWRWDHKPKQQYHSLEELPLMMNMTDVAAVLGISRAGAYKLAHSADFPAFQIGRRIVVSRENFLGWLDRQSTEQKCA